MAINVKLNVEVRDLIRFFVFDSLVPLMLISSINERNPLFGIWPGPKTSKIE